MLPERSGSNFDRLVGQGRAGGSGRMFTDINDNNAAPFFRELLGGDMPAFTGGPEDNVLWVQIQQKISQEQIMWQSVSNIIKTRYDAALNMVRNVKS